MSRFKKLKDEGLCYASDYELSSKCDDSDKDPDFIADCEYPGCATKVINTCELCNTFFCKNHLFEHQKCYKKTFKGTGTMKSVKNKTIKKRAKNKLAAKVATPILDSMEERQNQTCEYQSCRRSVCCLPTSTMSHTVVLESF